MEEKEQGKLVLVGGVRLVDARRAAALCSISARFWAQLDASGKVPLPRKLGRRSLWSVAEIDAWISAGCPERGKWAQMRQEKKTEKI